MAGLQIRLDMIEDGEVTHLLSARFSEETIHLTEEIVDRSSAGHGVSMSADRQADINVFLQFRSEGHSVVTDRSRKFETCFRHAGIISSIRS